MLPPFLAAHVRPVSAAGLIVQVFGGRRCRRPVGLPAYGNQEAAAGHDQESAEPTQRGEPFLIPLAGFLGGMIVSGQLLAVFMANAGGAWDNAKKTIEDEPQTWRPIRARAARSTRPA